MKAILHIGSNQGQREGHLQKAIQLISRDAGKVEILSPIYQTAAWGIEDQPDFLNQALILETPLPAEDLLHTILQIEHEMGRVRQVKWGQRLIDIDIIYFGQTIINRPDLQIPHPLMQDRNFVLQPLKDIAPHWEHPILKKNSLQLLEESTDPLKATKWQPEFGGL